ncbi:conjugal transfer protein TraG N-terminal domain-containing protein [Comamonas kerstersii]|uniref:conjugal transfer protein TraG N-terminal domain-containing protein n=1 Tax=Comamonas kerstersii TaxID=225992 RepID=UPI00266D2849|nr:conjugal transfer protein TraG N-terminal domain-containing protein [Comamonas kerstersii]
MKLDSYLEIFTTLYGWAFANLLGEIITGTGLAALPFALIVFNAWRDAKEKGMGFDGVTGLLESVQTKLITAVFVMMLCFMSSPWTSLSNVRLTYVPTRSYDGQPPKEASLQGGTGSGYDTAMANAKNAAFSSEGNLTFVPIWWYSIMTISSGVNSSFKAGFNSSGEDLRMIQDMARMATIEDSHLLHDIQRFYSECFVPARSKYFRTPRNELSPNALQILDRNNKPYGPGDVDWIGSQLFRTEPGFYTTMRSYNPVPGWAIDFSRDTDYIQTPATEGPEAGYVNPDWGRPTCKQWWETGTTGLRDRMVNHTSMWQRMTNFASSGTTEDQGKDSVAKLAFQKANPTFISPDTMLGNDRATSTKIYQATTGFVSSIGVGVQTLQASLGLTALLNALPMAQALILMALYMLLPLITFMSGYSLSVMWHGAIAIFTIKFWTVLWFVARWIDSNLVKSMYPGAGNNMIFQELAQVATEGESQLYKRMILEGLMMMMFMGFPLIWTTLVGWIGFHLNGLNNMAEKSSNFSKSVGSSSLDTAKKFVPMKIK